MPAKPFERYVAYLLEVFPLVLLALVPVFGGLASALYILFRDALFSGQSIGKMILKLRVVRVSDHTPATLRESVLRNFPLAIGFFLPVIPVIGHILGGTFASIVFVIEALAIVIGPDHRRIGDKLAGTAVVKDGATAR